MSNHYCQCPCGCEQGYQYQGATICTECQVEAHHLAATGHDPVNNPAHYTSDPSGVECIEITRHRNFNVGNAIKYLWRAGLKDDAQMQDLAKAVFYIQDEIARVAGADAHALRQARNYQEANAELERLIALVGKAINAEVDNYTDANGRIHDHRQGFISGMEYVRELLVDEADKAVARA